MKKMLSTLFILFMSLGAYAQFTPRAYSEIGKCVNAQDESIVLRLLVDVNQMNEPVANNALIVSELADPMNSNNSFMSAFSADFVSNGEGEEGGKIKFGTDEINLVKGEESEAHLGLQLYKCSLSF